jgi:uncharacterized membrane protein
MLPGALIGRFYYIYVVDYDRNQEWGGKIAMCAQDRSFEIRGSSKCKERGFTRIMFYEIDTGEERGWTVNFTDRGFE